MHLLTCLHRARRHTERVYWNINLSTACLLARGYFRAKCSRLSISKMIRSLEGLCHCNEYMQATIRHLASTQQQLKLNSKTISCAHIKARARAHTHTCVPNESVPYESQPTDNSNTDSCQTQLSWNSRDAPTCGPLRSAAISSARRHTFSFFSL